MVPQFGASEPLKDLVFSPDGKLLIARGAGTAVKFYDTGTGMIAGVLEAMDVDEIVRRTLAEHKVEVKAEIRLFPDAAEGRKDLGSMRVTMVGGGKRK